MEFRQRIDAFLRLGEFLDDMATHPIDKQDEIAVVLRKAEAENGWFTQDSIKFALESWADALSEKNLQKWLSTYDIGTPTPKTVAVIMAGNIPLVGFHDFLSVLITGHKALVKLSSNDKVLLPFLVDYLIKCQPQFKDLIEFTDKALKNHDAVIATGSNNTARYFDYYFGKYPHIIRKNRNSVAVLTGRETEAELNLLATDIFQYFGLGCRNVSKLYLPKDYDFTEFFKAIYSWKNLVNNNKYINNYDYNKAVYLMESQSLLDNEFLLLREDQGFSSPIGVLFFEYYDSLKDLEKELQTQTENIQCVVSNAGLEDEVSFGQAQRPKLWEYADGVDTVAFLLKLQP